jgi:hypothetical protein
MRDIDIRRVLRLEMARLHCDEPDTRIVEELGLCQGIARVDLAVVNGSVHGYEIKSEHDTLARLPSQTDVYSRALDFVTIVTAPSHADKISNIVPSWWGVWSVTQDEDGIHLQQSREPRPNPEINPFALAQFLWRDEALQALVNHGLATGMRSKPREQMWTRLAAALTLEDLSEVVRERLKRRGPDWRSPASPM